MVLPEHTPVCTDGSALAGDGLRVQVGSLRTLTLIMLWLWKTIP